MGEPLRYELVKAKTLLSKRTDGDSWFHSNHSMNIYRGCQFACTYCDGMSEYYHIDNYTNHIRVKENAPELLRKELKKRGYIQKPKSLLDYTESASVEPRKPIFGVSGGVSDSYQQSEKEFKVTRQVLEVLREYQLPVFLITKSDLVLRDIDILKDINEVAHVNINFSVAFADDALKKKFEPYSPSIDERLDALKMLREAGIHSGVMGLPVIPHVADSIDALRGLVKSVKAAKSEFLLLGGMTLKPGRQKTHFFNTLKHHFPEITQKMNDLYSNNNRYGQPRNRGTVNPFLLGPALCEEQGLSWLSIRHSSPGDYDSNSRLLGALLEYVFIKSTLLREPKLKWGPYKAMAVKVEQGLPPVNEIFDNPELIEKYQFPISLIPELKEMVLRGSSSKLNDLKETVLARSQRLLETLS
jgi:DNA repair photolyase